MTSPMIPLPARRRQRGQSTVEFVVLCLVLAVLSITVPLVGKYIDLMQATEQAGRYAAFEGAARNSRSTWKSDTDLSTEVRRRFYSSSSASAPVKTGDVAGDFAADRNALWSDYTGKPMLDNFANDVGVTTKVEDKNAIASAMYREPLNLSNTNFYTATISVKPVNVTALGVPWDALNLGITRRTVLLADAWTGYGAVDVQHRIESSVTMYPEGPAKALINTLGEIPPLLFDPALEVGLHDWDVVPCDRLVGGC
jgi:Flp pilus assembly protein TadG